MLRMVKSGMVAICAAAVLSGCQSPTDPDDTIAVDDFVEASQVPDPAEANVGDGRTYEKAQAELPSLFLPYDWKVRFGVTLLVNGHGQRRGFEPGVPDRESPRSTLP